MPESPQDCTRSLRLNLRHRLLRVRNWQCPGATRLARLIDRSLPPPRVEGMCRVRTLHGFDMLVDPVNDKGVEPKIFRSGTYEEGTLLMLGKLLAGGGTFIDIGANIGLMTLFAAKTLGNGGNVVAFEPMPGTYALLLQNIALNGLTNVRAEQLGIGRGASVMTIYRHDDIGRGAASLVREASQGDGEVSIVALDDYVADHKITNLTCLKIDVEGWELEAIAGASRVLSGDDAPSVIVECSRERETHGGTIEDLFELLTSTGVNQIFRLSRGKEHPSRLRRVSRATIPHHDNLFCFSPRTLSRLPSAFFEEGEQ